MENPKHVASGGSVEEGEIQETSNFKEKIAGMNK